MKIDFHVHVTPPDIIKDWKKIGEREPYFKLLSESPVNKFATAEEVVMELDNSNVDKAIMIHTNNELEQALVNGGNAKTLLKL